MLTPRESQLLRWLPEVCEELQLLCWPPESRSCCAESRSCCRSVAIVAGVLQLLQECCNCCRSVAIVTGVLQLLQECRNWIAVFLVVVPLP